MVSVARDVIFDITSLNGVSAGNTVFVSGLDLLTDVIISAKEEAALCVCVNEWRFSASIIQNNNLSS